MGRNRKKEREIMAVLTEGMHDGEFIVSEANGNRSRGIGTVLSGQVLAAGSLLGKVTASGKYKLHTHGASDGSENVAGIIFNNVDATDGDLTGRTIVFRDAEVTGAGLTYSTGSDEAAITAANEELAALGIIVR